ncbi:hypothetical protein RDE2_41950 [Rhodococcus sp. RDE2]|nr:hypothetical protein RDE2_41950 [Rhodococcus sp. RDE2]
MEPMHSRLSYRRTGSGDPLLLLHGIGATMDDFSTLVPRLAEHFDVLNAELPGYGSSPKQNGRPTVGALLSVGLDLVDRPRLGVVRVVAELGLRATLPQQVPALVEPLLDSGQPLQVLVARTVRAGS